MKNCQTKGLELDQPTPIGVGEKIYIKNAPMTPQVFLSLSRSLNVILVVDVIRFNTLLRCHCACSSARTKKDWDSINEKRPRRDDYKKNVCWWQKSFFVGVTSLTPHYILKLIIGVKMNATEERERELKIHCQSSAPAWSVNHTRLHFFLFSSLNNNLPQLITILRRLRRSKLCEASKRPLMLPSWIFSFYNG